MKGYKTSQNSRGFDTTSNFTYDDHYNMPSGGVSPNSTSVQTFNNIYRDKKKSKIRS